MNLYLVFAASIDFNWLDAEAPDLAGGNQMGESWRRLQGSGQIVLCRVERFMPQNLCITLPTSLRDMPVVGR